MLLCGECYENVYTLKAYKLSVVQGVERYLVTSAAISVEYPIMELQKMTPSTSHYKQSSVTFFMTLLLAIRITQIL
jgi:hypothetical protein